MRQTVVNGYRTELDLVDHIQRLVYLGAYERWETKMVRHYLQPGMCFLDVGANIGYFTLLAARLVGPTGRVFAIEPSDYAAERLRRTITYNQITQVQLEQCGLGRSASEVLLYNAGVGNHSPTMIGNGVDQGKQVTIRTLDDCVREWEVNRIDLMKIDVEGYEPEVFAGANKTIAEGKIRAILCEFNAHWLALAGTSSEKLYRDLLERGFVDRSGVPDSQGLSSFETRLFVWSGTNG